MPFFLEALFVTQAWIDKHLYHRSALSLALFPLSVGYRIGHFLHNLRYRITPPKPVPGIVVVAVGNITAGGTGKTPFTIELVRRLKEAGFYPAVCIRGYKGKYENENRVVSDGKGLRPEADEAGDEALMLAENLKGIPVVVGRRRSVSIGLLKELSPTPDVVVLDDGMQHRAVHHDLDIAIFQAEGGIGNGFLLPAGILREPVGALRGVGFIFLNGWEKSHPPPPWWNHLKRNQGAWLPAPLPMVYRLTGYIDATGNVTPPPAFAGKRIALLSGIGYPASFEQTVTASGVKFIRHYRLRDHSNPCDSPAFAEIVGDVNRGLLDGVIVTEKDYYRPGFPKFPGFPIWFAKVSLAIPDLDLLVEAIGHLKSGAKR